MHEQHAQLFGGRSRSLVNGGRSRCCIGGQHLSDCGKWKSSIHAELQRSRSGAPKRAKHFAVPGRAQGKKRNESTGIRARPSYRVESRESRLSRETAPKKNGSQSAGETETSGRPERMRATAPPREGRATPAPLTCDLLLVRHGQTSWNVEGRLQGQLNSDLTSEGVRVARLAGLRLGRSSSSWI